MTSINHKHFFKSYNETSIAKQFDFIEGNLIKSKVNFERNKEYQEKLLGRKFANLENDFILKSLIESEYIVNKKISLINLPDFVQKNDPHKIHIILTTTKIKNELLKNGLIYQNKLSGTKLVTIDNKQLENKVMLICNVINFLEGTKIELIGEDQHLSAKRELKLLFSKQKIWLCELI
jgi:hypothetical protein